MLLYLLPHFTVKLPYRQWTLLSRYGLEYSEEGSTSGHGEFRDSMRT
jgi:hypothetical protein